jgi:alcohol dehydrogenase (cytochrome c)
VFFRAIDPFSGKKVWDLPAPAGRSGVLSTAGGLIFLGGGGGLLVVDAKTGKPLWNVNISQTTQGSPMTFMVGGKQYIALAGTSSHYGVRPLLNGQPDARAVVLRQFGK